MEDIFEENEGDSDQENVQNADGVEELVFQAFPMTEPEIGAGDCRHTITDTTLIGNQTEDEEPSISSFFLKSRWFYYTILLSALYFLIRFEVCFDFEGHSTEVPFLEQMIRCNERRFELLHNLNIIHTALKRCSLEESEKDEAVKMLSQLNTLYEKHIVDLEKFTGNIPTSCKNIGENKVSS